MVAGPAVPLAGILASFALPPIHILPLLVTLSYPIARMLAAEYAFRFRVGWGCGLGWFLVSLYRISNAMPTGGEQFYWISPLRCFYCHLSSGILGVGLCAGMAIRFVPYHTLG